MALKTDKQTLTKEIKMAVKSGRNFVYAPSGGGSNPDVLMLSKKKIPSAERQVAKSGAGAAKVYFGTCVKEDNLLVFQCAIKPPETLAKRIKKSIKKLTDFTPPKVKTVFIEGFVEQDQTDDDDLKEMATVRRKSVVAAAQWVDSAKPEGFKAITEAMSEGHGKFDSEDWQGAIDSYDRMLKAVVDARKAASTTKIDEPEPTELKRKKLGKEYEGEDKKTGWRAAEYTDKQLDNIAVLKIIHKSAAYSAMEMKDFMALVKGKDPQVTKLIDQLKGALEKGDQAVVDQISKIKAQTIDERQKIRDSDQITTEYYTPKQRKEHGLTIGKDGLLYDSEDNLFDERKGFVLDPDTGNLVVFKPEVKATSDGKRKTTHHSSPLAGGDVGGAGHIKAEDGRVKSIDDASGHYKPDASFTLQTLKQLEKLGAKLVDDTIVDEDGDDVSEGKKQKFKLVKAYEMERKQKLKELLTQWKRAVKAGETPAGKPPELPPYDPNIAKIRKKLLRDGVGPSQKSTKVKLQGKVGLSQEQFDDSKGDVDEINRILEELTGKKNVLPDDLDGGVLNSRPALNLKIGEFLKRKLSKDQFEQTGGNEDQIRKKDALNEEIKTKGRAKALALALKDLEVNSLIAGVSKIIGVPEARLGAVSPKMLEEAILGADKNIVLEELKYLEKLRELEDRALEVINLKRTDPGVEEGLQNFGSSRLKDVISGAIGERAARIYLGLDEGGFW